MRFRCDECNAQYAIADEKVGAKGVRVRCKKCGHIITVRPKQEDGDMAAADGPVEEGRENGTVEREQTAVDQAPGTDSSVEAAHDAEGEQRDSTTIDQPSGEDHAEDAADQSAAPEEEGFNLRDDELGSALDQMLGEGGDEEEEEFEDEDHEDDKDFDRQSTRVFNVEEMQQVQTEREEAAQRAREASQISDLYESARASEESEAFDAQEHDSSPSEESGSTAEASAEPAEEDRGRVEWYAAVDEQQVGPMSLSDLADKYTQGEFDAETLVWKTGFEDWIPVFEVDDLQYLFKKDAAPTSPAEADWDQGTELEDRSPLSSAFDSEEEPSGDEDEADQESYERDDEDEEGLYDDEEDAYSSASAAAFGAQDVDWKPSAISNLDSLAEEELATLKPPPDPEPESDGLEDLFGDGMEETSGEDEHIEAGEMEDGDSSIIGQIAAEEEAAAERAEAERIASERVAEQARKKEEEKELAAQEAARREREEEQRERAAPPAEQVLPPKQAIPGWAKIAIGLGAVAFLGFIITLSYMLGQGQRTEESTVQPVPMTDPNKASLTPAKPGPDNLNETKPDSKDEKKTDTGEAKGETSPVDSKTGTPAGGEAEKPAEASKDGKPVVASKKEEPVPAKGKPHGKKRIAKKKRKKKSTKPVERKEVASVIEEPEPPPPPPEKKKPVRKKSSGGLLDFEDDAAFAKETGSTPTAKVAPPPKEVKKELPPLSNSDVLGVMRKHLAEFKACNRKQQEIDRSVKGKMVVNFTIKNNGRVAKVGVSTARFKGTFVAGCIAKVIKQARFPEFGGKPKSVPFPFTVK